jgi:hypothetical protein
VVDQIMKSSAILPSVLVSIASVEAYSMKASRELVASIEFFMMLSKPSSIAVLFLSIAIDEPPMAHAPSGD